MPGVPKKALEKEGSDAGSVDSSSTAKVVSGGGSGSAGAVTSANSIKRKTPTGGAGASPTGK